MIMPSPNLTNHSTQVLWLRQTSTDQSKVSKMNRLMNRCVGAGFSVHVLDCVDTSETIDQNIISVMQSDLVILESFGSIGRESNEGILYRVRQYSRAPVVLLTEDVNPEHAIDAIRKGADTVLPLYISEDVALARFHALLRRWTPKQSTKTV